MYALFNLNEDFQLSCLNPKFKDIGLRFIGTKKTSRDFEEDAALQFHFVYEITNEKKFKFFCITSGITPKMSKKDPFAV